jgi:hypothetical protein
MAKTIGIVGSRRRNTSEDLYKCSMALAKIYEDGDKLVSGGCEKGGDAFAEKLAKGMGLTITIHFPHWNGPAGKAAGFVRNTKIAEDCDVLIALVAEDRTGGTEDTVKKALKLGKKVILI